MRTAQSGVRVLREREFIGRRYPLEFIIDGKPFCNVLGQAEISESSINRQQLACENVEEG